MAQYQITILTALTAKPSSTVTLNQSKSLSISASKSYIPLALENTLSKIRLYGFDASDTPRDLFIEILQIPSKGKLYDKSTVSKSVIQDNRILPLQIMKNNYSFGIAAFYLGDQYYFTSPLTTSSGTLLNRTLIRTDSFTFRTFAADGSYSLPTTQIVTVKNINDPTGIDISNLKSSSSNVSILLNLFLSYSFNFILFYSILFYFHFFHFK